MPSVKKRPISDSIMLGDNPDADILGAINAGMDSVFVNHSKRLQLKAHLYIHHLKELEDIFNRQLLNEWPLAESTTLHRLKFVRILL